MVIAMVVSYWAQATYLYHLRAGLMASGFIPIALDALTYLCIRVLATAGIAPHGKRIAGRVLVFPAGVSAAINFAAAAGISYTVSCVFVVAIVLSPLAELVASHVRPDFS